VKRFIEQSWQKFHPLMLVFLPLWGLYWLVTAIRRLCYRLGIKKTLRVDVPLIIIGNLTVGGNGKTPVVVWLVKLMQKLGYNVGVISRGYGGTNQGILLVDKDTESDACGDEPRLIVNQTGCLMAVGRDRVGAAQTLIEHANGLGKSLDFIVSDDGLQHYRLHRDAEIIVIDGERRFGNGFLLPIGPNREGQWRLKGAMLSICNGAKAQHNEALMTLAPQQWRSVKTNEIIDVNLDQESTVAMAGIGYPQRFFDTVSQLGINPDKHVGFADHQHYEHGQLTELVQDEQWLLMTEKDAVKCREFAQNNWCYLPVAATFEDEIEQRIIEKLEEIHHGV